MTELTDKLFAALQEKLAEIGLGILSYNRQVDGQHGTEITIVATPITIYKGRTLCRPGVRGRLIAIKNDADLGLSRMPETCESTMAWDIVE